MNRADAALTRSVLRARLVVAASVLGGTLALAGLGAFGDLSGAPSDGNVGPGIATVELSQPVAAQ
ncbi:MAG TPA: hypothetical protein VFG13_01655 [Blastococcus sp.]|nr:hypothetical protein [Blastococcus sp.]